jgi:hypothetical protein
MLLRQLFDDYPEIIDGFGTESLMELGPLARAKVLGKTPGMPEI